MQDVLDGRPKQTNKQTTNLRNNSLILLPMKVFILTRRRREEGRISPNEACRPTRKAFDMNRIHAREMHAPQSTLPE